mgnify:CR=1 FL=1
MVQTDTAFLRIEAALGTSQHRVSFAVCSVVFSHVDSPSSAQNNRSAVLHLDEANSGVFNVVGLVVPGIELTAVVDLTLMLSIERVAELLESLPLRRDERYDVALALGEALGNAYDHAGGVGCVLTVQAYGDRVVLEVLDRGAGYSIDGASEPVASEERGRGIKLMRMLVDNVEVARRTDGAGTRVRMVKLFGSALESCA